jgi:hypothetical protein
MKQKTIFILAIVTILGISLLFTYPIGASQTATVNLSPSVISGANMSIGSTFTVSIQISGVTNLWGWTMAVSWDPLILQMQGEPTEGSFLKASGSTLFIPVPPDNTQGVLESMSDLLMSNVGVTGSGNLATMTFSVVSQGSCQISINNTEFDAPQAANGISPIIPVTITDATFTTSSATPSPTPNTLTHGPTASFSPADGSTFQLGTSITLDASSSQPGYDTQACPITNYAWSIEYLNGTTFASLSSEKATFNATVDGTYRIILIVTANDTHSPSDPSYVSTGSTSALINVISSSQKVNITVFTADSGIGAGANAGSYGPLQLVEMYASVTCNSASLPEENVIFSIQNSNGSVILVRQGITNQSGVCSANFTLPTPDPTAPQNSFGTWSIKASVNVIDVTVSDTINFTFNYQSGIGNVTIPASIHKSEPLPIQLTINNDYFSAQWTHLSITIFDQAGIPIGSTTVTTMQQTQNVTVIDATITIPSWAFTGQATAYLCLLANSTNTQAIPVAPETTATFQILP